MTLDIIIPTYKRREKLSSQLSMLTNEIQGQKDINIIIINNDPNDDLTDIIDNRFTLIQNKYNWGGSGNILISMQSAVSDYFWILGDDDSLNTDAVRQVLFDIQSGVDVLKYDDHLSENRLSGRISSINETLLFIDSSENISSFIFLSGWIFKKSMVNKYFNEIVMSVRSYMPQVILALLILRDVGTCNFLNYKITNNSVMNETSQKWPGALVHNFMYEYLRTTPWLDDEFVKCWRYFLFNEYNLKGFLGRHLRARDYFGQSVRRIVYGDITYSFFHMLIIDQILLGVKFIFPHKYFSAKENFNNDRL
jgi:hypothetical protein